MNSGRSTPKASLSFWCEQRTELLRTIYEPSGDLPPSLQRHWCLCCCEIPFPPANAHEVGFLLISNRQTKRAGSATLAPKGRSRGNDDRIVYSQHVEKDGKDLFKEICVRDLEGIEAKRRLWIYKDDGTSWLKIKNRNYSQAEGSHELLTGKRE